MSDASHAQPQSSGDGSHYQPSLGVVLLILILFVGAVFLMLRSNNHPSTSVFVSTTTVPASDGGTTSTTLPKNKVPVQVANGTDVSGLARRYTQQLEALNWDALPQVNGPKVTSTVVYYNPGFLWAAREIASEIKVDATAIQPLNGLSPVPGASGDDVIVILGPDIAIKG